jgi:hypothetical protein
MVMYGHKYTEEEQKFMAEYVPGHSYREIQQAFIEKFGWEITLGQVNAYIGNHRLYTGRTGRFEKGQEAHNKGKKMPPEVYEKAKATMFKKGQAPINYRPVGSERISKDGYIEVKVGDPNKWDLKHRIVYEQAFGKIPNGYALLFLDGNKLNCDISNLKLIRRSELLIMNRWSLRGEDAQSTDVASNLARLIDETNRKKKRNNGTEEKSNTKEQNGNQRRRSKKIRPSAGE